MTRELITHWTDYQAAIDEIDAGLSPHFNVRPASAVKVERVPEFREKTAPGAYYEAPAFDGSRPGIFYANLRNVDPRCGRLDYILPTEQGGGRLIDGEYAMSNNFAFGGINTSLVLRRWS